ncbi:MAG: hypothetical protein R3274_02575 [Desulfobacterales bacterium]|nr:hypothetical protein [Desulfobacterales bacterium]
MWFWLRFCGRQAVNASRKGGVSDGVETPLSFWVSGWHPVLKHAPNCGGLISSSKALLRLSQTLPL